MWSSLKMAIFWDAAPCSLADIGRSFREADSISRAMNGSVTTRLHGATCHKQAIFVRVAVRTWNLTNSNVQLSRHVSALNLIFKNSLLINARFDTFSVSRLQDGRFLLSLCRLISVKRLEYSLNLREKIHYPSGNWTSVVHSVPINLFKIR
jgi:hypothetical protein